MEATEVHDNGQLVGHKLVFGKHKWAKTCFKPLYCSPCPLFPRLRIEPDYEDYKKVIAVGEGPGSEERAQMKFFTGPSGQFLRAVEEDTRSSEFGIAHTNILLCEGSKDLDDEELDKALECCYQRLWDEIDEHHPELIVAAGNWAKSFFLPGERKGIGSIAGTLFDIEGESYKLLAIHHPAYILRNSKMFEPFWDQVNEIRLFFSQKPGPFAWHQGDSKSLDILEKYPEISIDCETTTFSPYDTGKIVVRGKVFHRGQVLCLAISGDGLNSYLFGPQALRQYHDRLKALLESKYVICFNGQFDIPFLNFIGIFPRLKDDPMLMHYSMDESPSHPLKRLSRRFLGLEDWSEVLYQYLPDKGTSYAAIPTRTLYKYCGEDTAVLHPLRNEIRSRMAPGDVSIYENLLIPCANMFIDVRHRGIRIDVGRLMDLRKRWLKERLECINLLKTYGVRNSNSPYQVSAAMIKLGIVDYDAETRKSNLHALRWECKEKGDDRGAEFLETVINQREVDKALNTFLRAVAEYTSDGDLKIHPDFKLFSTVTGRLTAGEPSLLNYPRTTRFAQELRMIFIPDRGNVWGHWDQKTFELRIYAVVNDDRTMKIIFAEDRDPHSEVGAIFYGSMEEYEKQNKKSKGLVRTGIKATNFGVLYGRGDESIAEQFDIPISIAAQYRRTIESMWEGLGRYRTDIEQKLNEAQELRNPLGRGRRFPLITSENYHECKLQAYNFPIQSTASDLNLLGMLDLHGGKVLPSIIPLFPVHDAIEFEIKESRLDESIQLIEEVLASVPRKILGVEDLKFATDGRVGNNWGEASME